MTKQPMSVLQRCPRVNLVRLQKLSQVFQFSPATISHIFRAMSENISPRSQGEVGEKSSDTGRANSTLGRAHGGTAFSAEQLSTAQT